VPVSTKRQEPCRPGDESECHLPVERARLFDIEMPVSDLLGFQEWLETARAVRIIFCIPAMMNALADRSTMRAYDRIHVEFMEGSCWCVRIYYSFHYSTFFLPGSRLAEPGPLVLRQDRL